MTGRGAVIGRSGVTRRWAAVAAAVGVVASGCGTTVPGTPVAEGGGADLSGFTDLLRECDVVADPDIAATVGADAIVRDFFGAICRWSAVGAGGLVKITFDWFETGSLDTEEQTARRLGYAVEQTTIEGRRAIVVTRPGDPGSCGTTLGAPSAGVVGWWVQYPSGGGDPCAAATRLAELTVDVAN
ncbi:DUF3558 domain-containing protein [Rhodococcus rhodnii]|uniref:Lipoprotein LprC n=2 Tax=Rhodococcus rhodnii TaxID=38312 RepID=R7WJT0_9NOCA|nr:DUF3558 domain-containing protein [Rhodococcus rhodnii]EOM75576.1 lipoprotein LprC [Rhodococcus rhodnii LMG 5362]TXG91898.1 DUF3558 domain-containing protein [Rhodococcus rhodnii]